MDSSNEYSKGFIIGALVGGVAGALTALLLAPKSGAELRKDIAVTSTDMYGKATDYFKNVESQVEEAVMNSVNEGKIKAQGIIDSARKQAQEIMYGAENILTHAKSKAIDAKDSVAENFGTLKDAAKAGKDAFQAEMKSAKGDIS